MITKPELDKYYTLHYERLHGIVGGISKKNKKTISPETILSECYINMLTKLDKIQPDKIGHFITSYARIGTSFSNNPLSKEERFNYTNPSFINSFSSMLFDGYEPEEFIKHLAIFDIDIYNEEQEIDISIFINNLVDTFKEGLNIVDKIIAEPLLDVLLNPQYNIKEHFIDEDEDTIKYYKKHLNKIKNNFIEYARTSTHTLPNKI